MSNNKKVTEDEISEVVLAFRDSEIVQARVKNSNSLWQDTDDPIWDFAHYEYRVKPKPLVFYVNAYEGDTFGPMYGTKIEAEIKSCGVSRIVKLVEEIHNG